MQPCPRSLLIEAALHLASRNEQAQAGLIHEEQRKRLLQALGWYTRLRGAGGVHAPPTPALTGLSFAFSPRHWSCELYKLPSTTRSSPTRWCLSTKLGPCPHSRPPLRLAVTGQRQKGFGSTCQTPRRGHPGTLCTRCEKEGEHPGVLTCSGAQVLPGETHLNLGLSWDTVSL